MRTRIFLTDIVNAKLVYREMGLLTDIDISAFEGQRIELDEVPYDIHRILFKMTKCGNAIDTEKCIILEEVPPEE
jgi:hypothetical protein